jgi:hypothetical protein
MEGDRKYRQRGYMDTDAAPSGVREDRQKPRGPRPPIDVTGPRLPRLVEATSASRCYNCTAPLPADFDFSGNCPKCNVALHCCKQCSYFEPSTRFQCTKPIPARVDAKGAANDCTFYKARVTVARDSAPPPPAGFRTPPPGVRLEDVTPKTANDARIAFDNLFKK